MRLLRALVLAVLIAASASGSLIHAKDAQANPGCAEGPQGLGACQGGGNSLTVSGTSGADGGTKTGGGSGPQTVFTLACGTSAEPALKALGDLSPALSSYTCDRQALYCQATGVLDKKKYDPVVTVEKQEDNTFQFLGNACVGTGPDRVTPALVREQAVRLIPTAAVGLAPRGTTLVNIETVMWADAPRQRELAPVTILGQQVVVRIVLDHVNWRFGDGEGEPNGPAGKAYDAKGDPCREKSCKHYFGHVYGKTGTVTVGATATWHASFTVAGGGPVDIPGTVDGPASQADIVIKQARGVLVPNPGERP